MTIEDSPFERVRRKLSAARIEFMSQLAKIPRELLGNHTEGEWSPQQLALHLYICDGLALNEFERLQLHPEAIPIDLADHAPAETEAVEIMPPLETILSGMAARRERLFQYLAALPEEAWLRVYQHPRWGEQKFYQLVNIVAFHDQMHTQQLISQISNLEASKKK